MTEGKVRALVVDDEPLARERIRRLLEEERDLEVVAEAESGGEAVRRIRAEDPDLVFLDIHLPDRDAFAVIRELGPERMPLVVFVTAHDEHALEAFEVHAADYVLKPFDEKRFRRAVSQARQRLELETTAQRWRRLAPAFDVIFGDAADDPGRARPAERLMVKSRGTIRFIAVDEIRWIEAAGNYVRLHLSDDEDHLVRETMTHLEERLDPDRFVRVHRSAMVNLDVVREIRHWSSGEYLVELEDGTTLKLTRTYRDRILDRVLG